MKPTIVALSLLAAACGGSALDPAEAPARAPHAPAAPDADPDAPAIPDADTSAHGLTTCAVDAAPPDTVAIRATVGGLFIGHGGVLSRATGSGCALQLAPGGFAMAEADLDVDDAGNVYLMPATSSDPAVATTETDDFAGVVRIDAVGNVEGLVSRGRWIAGFSIAPAGDELTVYGCAANGLHRQTSDGWAWDRETSASADQAGGVGDNAVAMGGGAIVMAPGDALLRVSASETTALGSAALALGAAGAPAQAPRAMTRCGHDKLCAVYADGAAVLGADGAVLRAISREALAIGEDERFVQATGDEHGVYVLLEGAKGARVLFVR